VRESGAFRDAAKRGIHRPAQPGEERNNLLPAAGLFVPQGSLRGPDRNIDKEITVNRRLAEVDPQLSLNGDRLEKFVRQKNFLASQLKQASR
jgi:hypothetical protein